MTKFANWMTGDGVYPWLLAILAVESLLFAGFVAIWPFVVGMLVGQHFTYRQMRRQRNG